jgi:predicted phosphodiesterase
VRIALIGDSHGFVPALEAALAAARSSAPDLLVFCGDLVTVPFSPDPPGETIELLRAEDVRAIYGNHDIALRAWGTPEWDQVMAMRMERGYQPGPWVSLMPEGQARVAPEDLAWLRALPGELAFDDGRVYVCHAIPGNPFLSLDGSDRRESVDPAVREAALRLPKPAAAELILCGHSHLPQAFCRRSPLEHGQTVVRTGAAIGWGQPPGSAVRQGGYAIVTRRGGDWEIDFRLTPWRPRDPAWTWRRSLEATGFVFPRSP